MVNERSEIGNTKPENFGVGPGDFTGNRGELAREVPARHGGVDQARHFRAHLSEQIIVTTAQRLLQPPDCCGQNVQLPGFNFLNGARSKVRQFRQLLLRETSGMSLPTNILTDGF